MPLVLMPENVSSLKDITGYRPGYRWRSAADDGGDRRGNARMNISEPFIRRPVATALLMAALAFAGIVAFPFLPVAPLPQVDFPTIQVTAGSGASAETMATSVAAPMEQQFGQIAGITQMTSQSSLGATTIVIQFDLERNIDSAPSGRAGGDHGRRQDASAGPDPAASLQEGQSGGCPGPDAVGAIRTCC